MRNDRLCAYCSEARGVHMDHVVPRIVFQRLERIERLGTVLPPWIYDQEPACTTCNWRKLTRLLIPPTWSDRVEALNALGIGVFRTWNGDVADPAYAEVHR